MDICFEGVGQVAATFQAADGAVKPGQAVTLTAGSTVGLGTAGAALCGVALSGGEGDVWGALAGGFFLSTILIAIISSKVPTFAQNFANYSIMLCGLILAVAIKLGAEYYRTRAKKKQSEEVRP